MLKGGRNKSNSEVMIPVDLSKSLAYHVVSSEQIVKSINYDYPIRIKSNSSKPEIKFKQLQYVYKNKRNKEEKKQEIAQCIAIVDQVDIDQINSTVVSKLKEEIFSDNHPFLSHLFSYSKNSYDLTYGDIKTLNPHTYLNDQIINFYIDFIIDKYNHKNVKVFNFSSFFYNILSEDNSITNSILLSYKKKKVFNWKKNIDKFSMDMWIIPINENYHWSAIIIYKPQLLFNLINKWKGDNEENSSNLNDSLPILFYLDSILDYHENAINSVLKYLYYEYCKVNKIDNVVDFFEKTSKYINIIKPNVSKITFYYF